HSHSLCRRPLCPTPFPYTTLFRSFGGSAHGQDEIADDHLVRVAADALGLAFERRVALLAAFHGRRARKDDFAPPRRKAPAAATRSEEHTSELQSPYDLVCRLLLEK